MTDSFENNDHHILRQFEQHHRDGKPMSPLEFVNRFAPDASHAVVLEIVAIDIELTLTRGVKPSLRTYMSNFSYIADQVADVYAQVVDTFVRKFCPIRSSLGELSDTPEYQIDEEIDRGGMGVVYQATQKSIGRKVALKVLFLAREEIFKEARRVATLNHPNICRIYDAGSIGEFPFMAMQLIRGQTLKQRMLHERLSIAEAIRVVIQIADALSAAHRSNIVHFDVKPENIVVNVSGHAWLMDFGLAQKQSEIAFDSLNLLPVSPGYSSPEQLSPQYGERGPRSDIYSLGLVLFELITGRRAYMGERTQIMDQLKHDPPRRPTDYDSQIAPELEQICLKAIQKHPRKRFDSVAEFRDCLTSFALLSGVELFSLQTHSE